MRGRGLPAAIAGVLVLALLGAGCGGSSDSGGNGGGGGSDSGGSTEVSESSVSKAQYAKQAEAICTKATEALEADFATFVKENESAQKQTADEGVYDDLLEEVVAPNISAEIEQLSALEVPEGDGEQVEAMLAARNESLAIAEEEPKAMIQNTPKVFGEASKLANEYGLKACATR